MYKLIEIFNCFIIKMSCVNDSNLWAILHYQILQYLFPINDFYAIGVTKCTMIFYFVVKMGAPPLINLNEH